MSSSLPGQAYTAAILAGGAGRRFGGLDKSALMIGAQSVLERQLALLRELTPNILIVANDRARYMSTGVPVVPDRIPGTGALGGLYTALVAATTEQVLVVACDMPFLTRPFLARVVAAGAGVDAAVPRDARGWHPLCASYATRVATHLRIRLDAGRLRVIDALDDLEVREIGPDELTSFDPAGRLLLNMNTPGDYAAARNALEQAPER